MIEILNRFSYEFWYTSFASVHPTSHVNKVLATTTNWQNATMCKISTLHTGPWWGLRPIAKIFVSIITYLQKKVGRIDGQSRLFISFYNAWQILPIKNTNLRQHSEKDLIGNVIYCWKRLPWKLAICSKQLWSMMGQFFQAKRFTEDLCADKFNAFNFQDVQLKETTGKPES